MTIGVNADPNHGITAEQLARLGVQVVRTAPWQNYPGVVTDYHDYSIDCLAHGIEPLFVVDKLAFNFGKGRSNVWKFRRLREKYPNVKFWQVGNEPDQKNSESSWYMTPYRFGKFLYSARAGLGNDVVIIAGGLVSGNPGYLDKVGPFYLNHADYIAVHPYGQRPVSYYPTEDWGFGVVGDLLQMYRRFNKPILVTEFGGQEELFASDYERAEYHRLMIEALDRQDITLSCVFCYADSMVPGYGLIDILGNEKKVYAVVKEAIEQEKIRWNTV